MGTLYVHPSLLPIARTLGAGSMWRLDIVTTEDGERARLRLDIGGLSRWFVTNDPAVLIAHADEDDAVSEADTAEIVRLARTLPEA